MKKKLSLMLCLCFMVLAMTACGTDPKSVDYFGMSYSDIQDNMEQTVSALVSFSDEDIQSGAEYYSTSIPYRFYVSALEAFLFLFDISMFYHASSI